MAKTVGKCDLTSSGAEDENLSRAYEGSAKKI
jgi:hypothetical protein